MCGLSRLVFPAVLVGMGVATMFGNATAGWLAAAAVAAALYLLGRRRPAGTCGLGPTRARPFEGLDHGPGPRNDRTEKSG